MLYSGLGNTLVAPRAPQNRSGQPSLFVEWRPSPMRHAWLAQHPERQDGAEDAPAEREDATRKREIADVGQAEQDGGPGQVGDGVRVAAEQGIRLNDHVYVFPLFQRVRRSHSWSRRARPA